MGRGLIARVLRARSVESGESVSDSDLLVRFLGSGDEAAFELLVWRHAVLVQTVCRRIVADDHLAEDAFQAVFLILARKARSVRGANLAGWLFRVARRVAIRARRQTAARPETTLTADPPDEPCLPAIETRELLAVLDEEVARLPDRFRLPVVLCYLGGRSTEDAARVLGCPRGTVLSRLATARERLAAQLSRRGVTLPAAGLIACSAGLGGVQGLVPPTVRLATAFAARKVIAGPGSPVSLILAEGVLKAMSVTKPAVPATILILGAGLVWGVGLVTAQGQNPTEEPAPGPVAIQPAGRPTARPAQDATPTEEQIESKRRIERIKKLDEYAVKLRRDIDAKEREVRLAGENTSNTERSRLRSDLERLDVEAFAAQKEIHELEVQLRLLQKRPTTKPSDPSPAEVEAVISKDLRIQRLTIDLDNISIKLRHAQATLPPGREDTPAVKNLKDTFEQQTQQIAKVCMELRSEFFAAVQDKAGKEIKKQIAKLEEEVTMKRAILDRRKEYRDEILTRLQRLTASEVDTASLLRELEPQREFLQWIERERIRLRLDLPEVPSAQPPNTAQPTALNAKLDMLLKEVGALRQEVRELKKP